MFTLCFCPKCRLFCRLLSSRYVVKRLLSILSNSLPSTLSSEIGRLSLTVVPAVPGFGIKVIVASL